MQLPPSRALSADILRDPHIAKGRDTAGMAIEVRSLLVKQFGGHGEVIPLVLRPCPREIIL
jgi:hypothetical protein